MTALYPQQVGQAAATTLGTQVTGSGTANTKGSWTQILPALTFDAFYIYITALNTVASATDTSLLLDVGIDPAGGTSYIVVVPNILFGFSFDVDQMRQDFAIPVYMPTGSTVAARIQSVITSETTDVAFQVVGGIPSDNPFPPVGLIVDYGTNTSDSGGVAGSNADANTKSAWVEITPATTHPHRGIGFAKQGNTDAMSSSNWFADIGIGSAGSEVVLIGDLYWKTTTSEKVGGSFPPGGLVAAQVPEGSRLAVRTQTEDTNVNSAIDVALYGWG